MAGYIGVFLLGVFVGGVIGVVTISLCVASKNTEVHIENMEKADKEAQEV